MFVGTILWIWLGTFIVSFGIDIQTSLSVFKYAADNGYKVNVGRLESINDFLSNDEMRKKTILQFFIPLYNLKQSKERQNYIINSLDTIISNLLITGVLEEMTEEDIEEYQKNPSISKALNIPFKSTELEYKKEDEKMRGIEEKLKVFKEDKERKRINDIEELKKLREEILEMSKSNNLPIRKIADIYLDELNSIESTDEIEDTPKLKKEL